MTIDGKYYTEPELAAKFRQMQETIQRLDGENHKLTEKLDEIGTMFNEQASLVGWHEEREKEFERLIREALKTMNLAGCANYCSSCKWQDIPVKCESFAWIFSDEALELIGEESDGI